MSDRKPNSYLGPRDYRSLADKPAIADKEPATDICPTCNRSKSAVLEVHAKNRNLLSKALRAICFMRDDCPADMPAIKGWEWFDVGSEIAKAIPRDEWAREFHLRVEVDIKHRDIFEGVSKWLSERITFYNDTFPRLTFKQFIKDSTLDTPLYDMNEEFFKELKCRLTNYRWSRIDWLLKCNVVRITDIMTEEDQVKLFDEVEIEDKPPAPPVSRCLTCVNYDGCKLIDEDGSCDTYAEHPGYTEHLNKLIFRTNKPRKTISQTCLAATKRLMKKVLQHGAFYADCPRCNRALRMAWTEGEQKPEMCNSCEDELTKNKQEK